MRQIDVSSTVTSSSSRNEIRALVPRAGLDVAEAMADVQQIIDQVRAGGVESLLELCERFDGIRPGSLRVPKDAIQSALSELDSGVKQALIDSI